jgi:hypothetical protein
MTTDGKSFQIWATPKEYGKTGKMSFYADSNDGDIRSADHQGEKVSNKDPVVRNISDELKNSLKKNRERN